MRQPAEVIMRFTYLHPSTRARQRIQTLSGTYWSRKNNSDRCLSLEKGRWYKSEWWYVVRHARFSTTSRILFGFQQAFRELIPAPQQRQLLTWKTAPYAFGYLFPVAFLAYLSRRRDTRLIRILLLPTTIVMCLRGTYAYDWFEPDYFFYTWCRGSSHFSFLILNRYKPSYDFQAWRAFLL